MCGAGGENALLLTGHGVFGKDIGFILYRGVVFSPLLNIKTQNGSFADAMMVLRPIADGDKTASGVVSDYSDPCVFIHLFLQVAVVVEVLCSMS